MAKKINSAKINKNIENVGEYSEMIKDKKWNIKCSKNKRFKNRDFATKK